MAAVKKCVTKPFFIPSFDKVFYQTPILQKMCRQILLNSLSLYRENSGLIMFIEKSAIQHTIKKVKIKMV